MAAARATLSTNLFGRGASLDPDGVQALAGFGLGTGTASIGAAAGSGSARSWRFAM
jgi:hypothetical protein